MPEWLEIVVNILSGLCICIPLVYKLVVTVQQAVREKNWDSLLNMIIKLMQEAESKFADGNSRREWVLMMVKASADTIQYDINLDQVAAMIDSLCDMTKVVNAPVVANQEIQK